ncbi:MAG: prepilin-type N-terminal cleavage/methylation domain-containing protein [Candidatus Omnitrophica bacterium]|nr:prepilin-type N-terminal cleavage/methylation domain-containing protein [Candidatus Omnitrophota bacterium]MBI2496121.1 prepilin-type N-terminal cleavage/methylation domain-containing protein [Candidatus Omnitrophota bacterium]MBI3020635.1 prepilin-type N-terminal cleavage/methylation domain-containing protein [Candidatus Omnitrophota bacterium]MBI3082837.1 prepilin-type N-terminal cleavage/methylation domain-containing protein [Candidatus Omnitrophota bacterium]
MIPPRPAPLAPRPRVVCGMTLLEVLVTLLILSVIVGAVFTSRILTQRLYLTTEAYVHVQQEARSAFDTMVRELRQARASTLAAGAACTFQVALGYALPAPCPANGICWGARDEAGATQSGWKLRYQLAGAQLVRDILNAADQPQPGRRVLANDVSLLSFSDVGGTVTIQLQVRETSAQLPGGSMSTPGTLTTRVRLRNS